MTGDKTKISKQAAVRFLQLIVSGRISEAYLKLVDMQGKRYNPFFAAGFSELQKAMLEDHAQFPSKQITVKNVLGDGDLRLCTPISRGILGIRALPSSTLSVSRMIRL